MAPSVRVLHIYQGQTFRDRLRVVDAAGDLIDLSALSARMQVRPTLDSPVIVVELTTEDGRIALAADGMLTFNLTAAETAALGAGSYDTQQWVYDLEIITPAITPIVDRILSGVVVFYPEVTR